MASNQKKKETGSALRHAKEGRGFRNGRTKKKQKKDGDVDVGDSVFCFGNEQ